MLASLRLIHWYDVERHAIACGAPGHTDSTKHRRDVNCAACLACLEEDHPSLRLISAASDLSR